jgi:predicted NACHT family NTPase
MGDRAQAATALKKYAGKYKARYGEVRLLGMKQGISLEEIYTKVRFLDELSIRKFVSLEALEQNYRKSQSRRFQTQKTATIDSITVVNENPYLMVLGGPGAGKSTFIRRMGLEALKGKQGNIQHQCIPVLLELKRLNSDSIDITREISNELANFGFPETEQFALNLLEQGKLLILLDGLDEVPSTYGHLEKKN